MAKTRSTVRHCHVQSQTWKGNLVRFDIRGILDSAAIPQMDREFTRRLEAGHDGFVVHLAQLTGMTLAGGAALTGHLRVIQERGGSVTLVQPSPIVEEVLTTLGVFHLLHVVQDTAELIGAGSTKKGG